MLGFDIAMLNLQFLSLKILNIVEFFSYTYWNYYVNFSLNSIDGIYCMLTFLGIKPPLSWFFHNSAELI